MKVLIAEDNSIICKTLEMFLKQEGFDTITTFDGLDAIQKIEKYSPDVILVDIMLPYYSGLEIMSIVKQSNNPIPVIVTSAMSQEDVIEEALQLGADGFIAKPYDIDELMSKISDVTSIVAVA
jgi:DNA-binding response OmpR family regulator